MIPSARGRAATLAAILLGVALLAAPPPAAAQGADEDEDPPRLMVTAWSGFSIREGQTTFRFADDMMALGARVTLQRTLRPQPFVQLDYYWRPDLICSPEFPCNDAGVAVRGGIVLPVSEDETRLGFHPRLLAGVGAGFADETDLAYMLGIGGAWLVHPRIAPSFEARWERVPGLRNIVILAAGLRLGLL